VKISAYPLSSKNRWLVRPVCAGAYHHWLIEPASLTARLQAKAKKFSVRALSVINSKPLQDELSPLALIPNQLILSRDVLLLDGNIPLVFAHSVLPHKSLRGIWRGLSRLGNQSLGAALFSDPRVTRTSLQFKKVSKHHPLYEKASQHFSSSLPTALWARRSIFYLNTASRRYAIMVTEVFLPKILD
jgi:chorismate--pyruvate lyase